MRYDYVRKWLCGTGAAALTFGLVLTGNPTARAQEPTATAAVAGVTTPPVDLHNGTCANPQLEPDYELGDLTLQEYGEVVDDLDEDGILDVDEEGYLTEDLDDDGVLDDGEDLDDDGVLDTGIDADGDGVLDDDEVIVAAAVDTPRIFKAEAEIDATFDDLFASPEVVAVHKNANEYDTIIACGELMQAEDADDEDQVVIALRPINGSGYYGYAVFERDTGNVPIFGENTTGVTVYLFEGLSTQRQDRMTPTPDATTPTPLPPTATPLPPTPTPLPPTATPIPPTPTPLPPTATPIPPTPAVDADIDGDGILNVDEEGYLTEDLDGDGVLDDGEDLDADGVLDEGIDANGDGILDDDEIFP
jgi:hypothetical protein